MVELKKKNEIQAEPAAVLWPEQWDHHDAT